MNKLIILFLKNIKLITTIVFLFCFFLPVILKYINNKQLKKRKKCITNINIILYSKVLDRIILSLFMILFLACGLFLIIYADTIVVKIFGCFLSLLYIFVTITPVIQIIKILNGKYIIRLDKLINKKIIQKEFNDDNGHSLTNFYLLKFEKYKSYIRVDRKTYNFNIGDEFYLVFLSNEKEPIGVFNIKYWSKDIS